MRAGGNVSEIFVSFQGEGLHAGRRHLFVRLGGCPLRCRYCDTPDSLVPVDACHVLSPDGSHRRPNPLSVDDLEAELASITAVAPPLHALAVTGGEPLMQADFVATWLRQRSARAAERLPILLETAGILPARLAQVLPWIAIVSLDLKCPSNTGERPRWDEHEACLAAAVGGEREVYVKMPVDDTTAADEVEQGAALLARVAPGVPLFLTPLTPPSDKRLTITAGTLDRFHALASRRHRDVRVLPQIHKALGIL